MFSVCNLVDWPGRPPVVLRLHRAPLDASSSETPAHYYGRLILAGHEHICGNIGHLLNIDQNSASGDLSGGEPERKHTEHIAPCSYSYTHKYRIFSFGRPASMRAGQNIPGGYLRSVVPEHTNVNTEHLAPDGLRACVRDTSPGG